MTLSNSCSAEPFHTVRGIRQDDPLLYDLFNFLMESWLRKSVQLLAYADIDIIGRTMRAVSAALSAIERESAKMVLTVNEGKTKDMLSMSGIVPRMAADHG